RAPRNIRQQTRRMTQAPILLVLLEMGRSDQAIGPSKQLFPMLRRSRAQLVEFPRGHYEGIFRLLLRREPRIEQPLANAKRRNNNLLRTSLADDLFQHC